MRKNQIRVQGPRTGTIRANDARDLREYYKGFQGQFRHEYFAGYLSPCNSQTPTSADQRLRGSRLDNNPSKGRSKLGTQSDACSGLGRDEVCPRSPV